MRIKKKNVARLASLSALGAGALGVAAGTAQASIISGAPGVVIGPGAGQGWSRLNFLSNNYDMRVGRYTNPWQSGTKAGERYFVKVFHKGAAILTEGGQATSRELWVSARSGPLPAPTPASTAWSHRGLT